jgi:SAM-dependent methyltransferase
MQERSISFRCDRKFRWMSSITGDEQILSDLNRQMMWFYGQLEGRRTYQEMLETQEGIEVPPTSVRYQLPQYISLLKPTSVLEIGCGDGRVYRQLRDIGFEGSYFGIEVAKYIIRQNEKLHPEATWRCGHAYEIPFSDSVFDVCYSLYVLEHLVFPERALREMLRVLKPDGKLILVYPDFVKAGRFGSQQLGFSVAATASEKLRSKKVIDALVSFYDSRVRLKKALGDAVARLGPFPVNTRPACLSYPSVMREDIDAIYIASKQEVYNWATENGFKAEYPCGTEGEFAEQVFIVITK